jgi:hypothetical protein
LAVGVRLPLTPVTRTEIETPDSGCLKQ